MALPACKCDFNFIESFSLSFLFPFLSFSFMLWLTFNLIRRRAYENPNYLHLCSVGTSSKRCLMSTSQLVDFLNKTQRDPRLNEILYPYANPARAKELICQYEPNKFNAQKGQLSLDGFLR